MNKEWTRILVDFVSRDTARDHGLRNKAILTKMVVLDHFGPILVPETLS